MNESNEEQVVPLRTSANVLCDGYGNDKSLFCDSRNDTRVSQQLQNRVLAVLNGMGIRLPRNNDLAVSFIVDKEKQEQLDQVVPVMNSSGAD